MVNSPAQRGCQGNGTRPHRSAPPPAPHSHTLLSGAIQLSPVVRSQAPSEAISGWWSCILQTIVGVPGARSSQIWSPTRVEKSVRCWSQGMEREGKKGWVSALGLYCTAVLVQGMKSPWTGHIEYRTRHLTRFLSPLYDAVFPFLHSLYILCISFSLSRKLPRSVTRSPVLDCTHFSSPLSLSPAGSQL